MLPIDRILLLHDCKSHVSEFMLFLWFIIHAIRFADSFKSHCYIQVTLNCLTRMDV